MGSIQKAAVCLFALITIVDIAFAGGITLDFSLIVSYGRYGYNSSPSIPAIDLALEHIERSGILNDYELQYTMKDSEVSIQVTIGVCVLCAVYMKERGEGHAS